MGLTEGSTAHLQINCSNGRGIVYAHRKLVVFDTMIFCTDSIGHMASVENYTPCRIMNFGGLEYTVDSHGKLVLVSGPDIDLAPTSQAKSGLEPTLMQDLGSLSYPLHAENMPTYT